LITEDYVNNGETGIVITPNDVDHMKNMILQILDNKSERKRIGDNARKWVLDNATIEICTKNLANILQNSCCNKKLI
jgi:glycosyltransferase involved in cell wall biosynthesis